MPTLIVLEIPTGVIDGINGTFSASSEYRPNSLIYSKNGQELTAESTELGGTSFSVSPVPEVGDEIAVQFIPV